MKGAPQPWQLAGASAVLILIWGTTWAAVRLSLEAFPPWTGVAVRFGIASVILLVVSRLSGVPLGKERREWWLWPFVAISTYVISYGVVYWSEQWVPSGLASVLFSTFPLFVLLWAFPLLPAERPDSLGLVGFLAAFGGIAVIFSEDLQGLGGRELAVASAVMLLSPFSASFGQVVIKRWGQGLHALSFAAVPMAMASVIAAVLAWIFERHRPISLQPLAVAATFYLAIVGSAMAFSLYFWLLGHGSATRVSLVAYAAPVVAVAVGTWTLGEPLTPRLVAGSLLVLVGAALAMGVVRRGAPKRATAPIDDESMID